MNDSTNHFAINRVCIEPGNQGTNVVKIKKGQQKRALIGSPR